MITPPPPSVGELPPLNKKRSAEPETLARNLRRQLEVEYWIEYFRRDDDDVVTSHRVYVTAEFGERLLRDPAGNLALARRVVGRYLVGPRYHTNYSPIAHSSNGESVVLFDIPTHWTAVAQNSHTLTRQFDLRTGDRTNLATQATRDFAREYRRRYGEYATSVVFTTDTGDREVYTPEMRLVGQTEDVVATVADLLFNMIAEDNED